MFHQTTNQLYQSISIRLDVILDDNKMALVPGVSIRAPMAHCDSRRSEIRRASAPPGRGRLSHLDGLATVQRARAKFGNKKT